MFGGVSDAEKLRVFRGRWWDRHPSFPGRRREDDVKITHETHARKKNSLVLRSSRCVPLHRIHCFIRIARQISACIPTLSAPAAWLSWFLRDVIPRRRKPTSAREEREKERHINVGGKERAGAREERVSRFVCYTHVCILLVRVYVCARMANASFR